MCKLYTIIDIESQVKAERLVKVSVPYITKTDSDGLGIMRLGDGAIHSQKWVTVPTDINSKPCIASPYADALKLEYLEKGKCPDTLDAIAVHGRKATCGINIENTHPFQTAKTALMHNGIISVVDAKDQRLSTCDSEVLLWRYLENNIREKPELLTKALDSVQGYYACIVFNVNGVVDIWTDELATLVMAKVSNVGTVIATTKDIIIAGAKKAHFKVEWCYPIKPYTHLRWESGERPLIRTFLKPVSNFGYETYSIDKEIKDYDKHSPNWWNDKNDKITKGQLERIEQLKDGTLKEKFPVKETDLSWVNELKTEETKC